MSAAYAQLRSKRKAKKRRNKKGVRAMFSHQTKPKNKRRKQTKGQIGQLADKVIGERCVFLKKKRFSGYKERTPINATWLTSKQNL